MAAKKLVLGRGFLPLQSNIIRAYASSTSPQDQLTTSFKHNGTVAVLDGKQNLSSTENESTSEQKKRNLISFADFENAFKVKTSFEIVRALAVYKICSFDFLVERNRELIKLSRALLGKTGFEYLMKNSFYGHFVAGESQVDIKPKLDLMQKFGVGAILDYAVEADIPKEQIIEEADDGKEEVFDLDLADAAHQYQVHREFMDRREQVYSARTYFYEGEEKCDKNMEIFLQCIDTTANASENGFAAIKVTALGRPSILLRLSQILNQIQFFFDEIATTGDTLTRKEIAEERFIEGLERLGVDMNKEGAKELFNIIDVNKDGSIDIVEWHNFLTPQLQLSKVFRTKRDVGKEIIATLSLSELQELENMVQRMLTVAKRAEERNVRLMVDAEQTYFQPAISRIVLEAQRSYNRVKPVVFNTYQCYLKNITNSIEVDMELSRREGFHFGAKIVRGAYMEQERLRAETVGYADPIHNSYEETDRCYNSVLSRVLAEVALNNANIMVATHNEGSVRHAISTMEKLKIEPNEQKVFFGQLLGMCDVISYALGGAGYSAFKYVPYGPVQEVIPYLSRRAMENRSVMKGVVKERNMLWSELRRRFKTGTLRHDPNMV